VWRKSSASLNGNCVEVADTGTEVYVRDSKNRTGPYLRIRTDNWRMFIAAIRAGDLQAPGPVG